MCHDLDMELYNRPSTQMRCDCCGGLKTDPSAKLCDDCQLDLDNERGLGEKGPDTCIHADAGASCSCALPDCSLRTDEAD